MEPAQPTVENLCSLLIRSRLLQAAEVQTMHRRWRLEAKDGAENPERFARWMVSKQYVTDYQAQALLRGHADHFFLNHYKILERIGKGRMAGVFKAVHNLGHTVAIKVLPPSKTRDPQSFGRFQRESKMALKLKHPNVVRSFHVGHTNNLHYLVMEYLEGETLEDVLKRRGKLPPAEGVRIVHQALSGLQHIHQQGLIHRDLEPGNLMLVPNGPPNADSTLNTTVKILDIGLGRTLFDEKEPGQEDAQLTTEGAVIGCPDYLAPEQARDARKVDIRADIYSLGCILYHELSGQVPFPDKSPFQQIVRHATEPLKPIRDLVPSVPEPLQQVINKMMAKDPKDRYATPEQVAQALTPFLPGPEKSKPADAAPQAYLNWVDKQQVEDDPAPPAPTPVTPVVPVVPVPAVGKMPPAAIRPQPAPSTPAAVANAAAPQIVAIPAPPLSPPLVPSAPAPVPLPPVPARSGAGGLPVAAPLPAGAVADVDDADVELVSVPEPTSSGPVSLNRRDVVFLMVGFFFGAAVATIAGGIVWLMYLQPME
ncbi:MAG: serine/threonine-protein kinase [Gemmataceae bacterium]